MRKMIASFISLSLRYKLFLLVCGVATGWWSWPMQVEAWQAATLAVVSAASYETGVAPESIAVAFGDVGVVEGEAPCHGRENATKPFAVAAGIADLQDAIDLGFFDQGLQGLHAVAFSWP